MKILIDMWATTGDLLLTNIVLQTTIIALGALVVAEVLKHKPALRYGVLYPSLLSLVLVLPLSVVAHVKDFSLVNVFDTGQTQNLEGGVSNNNVAPAIWFDLNLAELFYDPLKPQSEELIGESLPIEASNEKSYSILLATVLLGAWILGVAVSVLKLVNAKKSLALIIEVARQPSPTTQQRLDYVLGECRGSFNSKNFRFLESDSVRSPVLVGVQDPVILLPANLLQALSDYQLKGVLLHELAHLERGDVLANYVQRLVCCVFWFHPIVAVLDKLLNRAREEICDNYVLEERDPLAYSEVLFRLSNTCEGKSQNQQINTALLPGKEDCRLTLGIIDEGWTLEERIAGLLNDKRETTMKLNRTTARTIQLATLPITLFLAACQFSGTADLSETDTGGIEEIRDTSIELATQSESKPEPQAEAEPRLIAVQSSASTDRDEPPQARKSGTLSDEVMAMVAEIQSLLSPEDESIEPDNEAAKVLLDELTIDRYASLNDFEKQTALNFLVNYHLAVDEYREAAGAFERILTIENVRAETRLRSIRALGQLYASFEEWEKSNEYYHQWRELAALEDDLVYRGLSYNFYQLEQWDLAIENWESYMALQKSQDKELSRNDYAYLNGMYFTADYLDKALANAKEMILLFNNETDWLNIRKIYSMIDARDQAEMTENELLGQLQNAVQDPKIIRASLTQADGDYLPLIAVAPMYPTQAANDGIEGWSLVEFTVLEDGRVDEQSVEVIDAEPATIFDKTSIRAANKFEFQPRVVDGEAVAVPGVQYVFRFRLEEEV